jgi:hypothetical protein
MHSNLLFLGKTFEPETVQRPVDIRIRSRSRIVDLFQTWCDGTRPETCSSVGDRFCGCASPGVWIDLQDDSKKIISRIKRTRLLRTAGKSIPFNREGLQTGEKP